MLTLTGNNTYSGGTNIQAGTLSVANNYNLGDPSGNVHFIGGGTSQVLQFASGFDTPDFTRNILLDYQNGAGTGTIDTQDNDITLSGTISTLGQAGLSKAGTGTLTLPNVNHIPGAVNANVGTLQLAANQTFGSLNVAASASVQVVSSPHNPIQLTTSSLNIASLGSVDLSDNDLAVSYVGGADPLAAITGDVKNAYDNGHWDQPGLTSSAAAGNSATALGIVDDTTNSIVRVSYTWYGDLDLSGSIDASDWAAMGVIPTTGP